MTHSSRYRIVGRSRSTCALRKEIARVGRKDDGVLLVGEAGAGKELAARSIHMASARRRGPFRIIDCARFFPEDLSAILFGAEDRPGTALLSRADRGTLYVVHPAEMVASVQERLVAFLRTGEFTVGEAGPVRRSDVRLLSGTEKDLETYVRGGMFLWELWERVSAETLRVPPLRERIEDIGPIMEHLLGAGLPERFAAGVLPVLENYPWPGNYDELIEEVERLLRTGYGCIDVEHVRRDIVNYEGAPLSADPEILHVLHEIERCIQTFHIHETAPLDFAPYFWRGGPVPGAAPSACEWDNEPWEHDLAW